MTDQTLVLHLRHAIALLASAMALSAWYENWAVTALLLATISGLRLYIGTVVKAMRKVQRRQHERAYEKMRREREAMEQAHATLLSSQLHALQHRTAED